MTHAPSPRPSSPWHRRWLAWLPRGNRGNVAVEFALVGPLFLLMTFAVIDVGRYYQVKQALEGVSGQLMRAALINGALSGSSNTVVSAAGSLRGLATNNLALTVSRNSAGALTTITVSASYPFKAASSLFNTSQKTLSTNLVTTF